MDGERNPIGRRTESDWTADANGEKSLGCVSLEMSVEPKINPEVHFYWASGRIFMLFGVLPDSYDIEGNDKYETNVAQAKPSSPFGSLSWQ